MLSDLEVDLHLRFPHKRGIFLGMSHHNTEYIIGRQSNEDADSILRFKLVCKVDGVVGCCKDGFVVAPPTRLLVFRPAPSPQPSVEKFVDGGATVAIVLDMEGAEVALKDVVGHSSPLSTLTSTL